MITERAPGKIILLGEHAVLYGEPAIGLPLSRGVSVSVKKGRGGISIEVAPKIEVMKSKTAAEPRAFVARVFGKRAEEIDVAIRFEIPPMAGLGSSAALAVALLRARDRFFELETKRMLERAIAIENVAHGRSSGVDPAIALASGPIVFRKRRVRALACGGDVHLVVGARGGHGGTGRSIGNVSALKAGAPKLVKSAMQTLGAATTTAIDAFESGDLALAGRAFDLAHGVLGGLGLVSRDLDEVVRVARDAGALGAKMSGAGGRGGAFVALASDSKNAEKIRRSVAKLGALAWIERAQKQ